MKKKLFFIILLALNLLISSAIIAQSTVHLSGFVKDKTTGESIVGAIVKDSISQNITISDYNGYYSCYVKLPGTVQISYIGYKTINYSSFDSHDTIINFELEQSNDIKEVIVIAERQNSNISSLNKNEIFQIPTIGGNNDIGKSLQLLPGILSTKEASSVLTVRGGDPGQNLYLFDNVPVIYVNHLGGFMSVFNSDIINNIDVYKGAFPSAYGGKLSSVTDIVQKEGDVSGLKGSFGIGITDASFSIEGPLKNKNTSFIVTGRKTLIDGLLALLSSAIDGNNVIALYGFHDINAKFTWKPDTRKKFTVNLYQGDDYLKYWLKEDDYNSNQKYKMSHNWGNILMSIQYQKMYDSGLLFKNSISYTRYRLKDNMNSSIIDGTGIIDNNEFRLSGVQNFSYKSSLKKLINPFISTELGFESSLLFHLPEYNNNSETKNYIKSSENALFIENKITFLKTNTAFVGFRQVYFINSGFNYFSFEPRLSLNIHINSRNSLNFSYMKISQYSQLMQTQGDIMNNEIWIPANKIVLPAYSNQITCGWNSKQFLSIFSAEMNVYYKTMYNLSTYKEGYFGFSGDVDIYSKIETDGTGIAKGIELLLKKNAGNITGFLSYSISNSSRQYPNINNGNPYMFEFDRLHSLAFTLNYKINKKLNINAVWVFQSGLPYTPAIGRQLVQSLEPDENSEFKYYEALIYGVRNSERLKDYHRLDIGINYEKITKRNRKAILSLSVYNVYNRHNPFYYYFNSNGTPEIINPEYTDTYKPVSLYQISFFPVFPSISYKVFFDKNNNKTNNKTFKQNILKWLYHENN
jgi:hypothetical protein